MQLEFFVDPRFSVLIVVSCRVTFGEFQAKIKTVRVCGINKDLAMVIRGTVHNGYIKIEDPALPEGTQVLITPINSPDSEVLPERDLTGLKTEIHRIASLACENGTTDGFSGVDHDKVLYGN